MWLDIVILSILVLFAALGAWRGAFSTGTGLASILVGYGGAVFLAPVFAPGLTAVTGVSELLALPLGGTLGFVVGYIGVAILVALLRKLTDLDTDDPSPRDRFLGATFGTARGALIAALVSWLAMWVDTLPLTGAEPLIPPISDSRGAAVTGRLVEAGLGAALADSGPAGRVVARIAGNPSATLSGLEEVFESPGFGAVRDDSMFWTYVEHGNVDSALNRGSFRGVMLDAPLRRHLANLGFVPDAAGDDAGIFRDSMADVLLEVGPRIKGIRNDPELLALAENPEVVALVQSGDTLGLMGHPSFRRFVDRVISEPEEGESPTL